MTTMTMTKIETKARSAYFASEARKAIGISIYTNGYKEGFVEALSEVKNCMGMPNNKERLDAILKLIDDYELEGRS